MRIKIIMLSLLLVAMASNAEDWIIYNHTARDPMILQELSFSGGWGCSNTSNIEIPQGANPTSIRIGDCDALDSITYAYPTEAKEEARAVNKHESSKKQSHESAKPYKTNVHHVAKKGSLESSKPYTANTQQLTKKDKDGNSIYVIPIPPNKTFDLVDCQNDQFQLVPSSSFNGDPNFTTEYPGYIPPSCATNIQS